ncbi:MAG: amino acid permease [Myxococcota bacterium]
MLSDSTAADGPQGRNKMGLVMATALVTVNMIGTGIFLLPVSMASVGSISILGWLVAVIGAGAIGLMFAFLGATDPQPGGPYAYARRTFGPYLGFQTNYAYWIANLVGNIAVATTVTSYATTFVPALKEQWLGAAATIAIVWGATFCNILGPRFTGLFTSATTFTALIPLAAVAALGWIWFDPNVFRAGWNPGSISTYDAVSQSATFALWAFIGIESASVAAGVIDNPKRNVPLATMLGLAIAAVLYVSTCVVLMGIIPTDELAKTDAPFTVAAQRTAGSTAALVIGIAALLKASGSLVGWTLTIAQSAEAAARDGIFPRIYGVRDRRGIPVWNFLVSATLMSIIVLLTASPSLTEQFTRIIDTAIILTLLPYLYSGVTFLMSCQSRDLPRAKLVTAWTVTLVAMSYCLFAVAGSKPLLTRDAMILLFLSVPFYLLFLKRPQKD